MIKKKTYKLTAKEYARYYHLQAFEKQAKNFKRSGFFYGIFLGGGIFTFLSALFGIWGTVGYFLLAIVLMITYPFYRDLIEDNS